MREASTRVQPVADEGRSGGRGLLIAAAAIVCGVLIYWGVTSWNGVGQGSPNAAAVRLGQRLRAGSGSSSASGPQTLVLNLPGGGEGAQTVLAGPRIFNQAAPNVTVVLVSGSGGERQGSGVVIGKGRVITNRHVVSGATEIRIGATAGTFAASVLRDDPQHDLSLLSVPGLDLEALPFRTSGDLQVGEKVYAIGAPKGLALTFSEGLISGLRPYEGGVAIQTTAPLSPGSSGGGLLDAEGRLIGITTFGAGGENLNFALPAEWALTLDNQSLGDAPVVSTATAPQTENQRERQRAEAVYRPRMTAVAAFAQRLRVLNRRYGDACYLKQTVTVKNGQGSDTSVENGSGSGSSQSSATYSDRFGRVVGYGSGQGSQVFGWSSVKHQSSNWREVATTDNASTPECRLIASEIGDLLPKINAVMEDADREAVRQKIWTWLQGDLPDALASELWVEP